MLIRARNKPYFYDRYRVIIVEILSKVPRVLIERRRSVLL
jgi:hypothetical protein